MPILNDPTHEPNIWALIDAKAADVVTVGIEIDTTGLEVDFHHHRKAQLLFSLQGVLTCEADRGIWMVQPQCAVWIPAGVMHRISLAGKVKGYNAFIEPTAALRLPSTCCTISVTPLLRELLIRSAGFALSYEQVCTESRVSALLLDEIATAPLGQLHLPMPTDKRLRSIFQMLMASPSDRGTIESWARRVGLSERTLARVVDAETGMSFGRWRQQLTIILAVQWMAKGSSIQQVATDLGYESVGSFVTMFRKAVGTPPGRYMADQHAGRRWFR